MRLKYKRGYQQDENMLFMQSYLSKYFFEKMEVLDYIWCSVHTRSGKKRAGESTTDIFLIMI